jgi:hypothetical protein
MHGGHNGHDGGNERYRTTHNQAYNHKWHIFPPNLIMYPISTKSPIRRKSNESGTQRSSQRLAIDILPLHQPGCQSQSRWPIALAQVKIRAGEDDFKGQGSQPPELRNSPEIDCTSHIIPENRRI